jgi:hypothetical protein
MRREALGVDAAAVVVDSRVGMRRALESVGEADSFKALRQFTSSLTRADATA